MCETSISRASWEKYNNIHRNTISVVVYKKPM